MDEELLGKLRAKKVSESAIQAIESEGFDTLASLVGITDEVLQKNVGIDKLSDRNKILAFLRETSVNLVGATAVSAIAATVAAAPEPDYSYLLGGGSAMGLSPGALNPNINTSFVEMAGRAVLAYVLMSARFDSLFDGDFWKRFVIEDWALRRKIADWQQAMLADAVVGSEDRASLIHDLPSLFDNQSDGLIAAACKLASSRRGLELVGAQSTLEIGADAPAYASLTQLIPFVAEAVSRKMICSRMPEQTSNIVKRMRELVDLLKEPSLQSCGGVNDVRSPDEGAVIFLQKCFSPEIVAKFRLALAYERFLCALAVCPTDRIVPAQYLTILGTLANEVRILFALVTGNGDKVSEVKPFANLSLLAPKKGEPVIAKTGSSSPHVQIPAGLSTEGWPFRSFVTPIPGNKDVKIPILIVPYSSALIEFGEFETIICGGIMLRNIHVDSLIYFGNRRDSSVCISTISHLYCLANSAPILDRSVVLEYHYMTRDDLIAEAIRQAAKFGIALG